MSSDNILEFFMRTVILTVFLTICLVLVSGRALADEKTWKLVSDRRGVQLYKDMTRGVKHRMFKAVTVIDAPIETIMDVLLDAGRYPEWMPGCMLSRVLSEKNGDRDIRTHPLHLALNIPWPMRNRDFVTETKTFSNWDTGTFFVEFNTVDRPDIPSPRGSFRMIRLYGKFEGEAISRYQTRMTYHLVFNPGGRVGSIMSNRFTGRIARNTMTGLARVSEKPEYKKAAEQNRY